LGDGAEEFGDFRAFLEGEFGAPDVEQEDDACFARLVLCLMLDTVIEDDEFAFLPVTGLIADPQPGGAGHQQGQVADQAGVDQAVMGRNGRAGLQQGEQDRRCLSGQVIQRQVVERGGRDRAAGAVFLNARAILPEIEGAPVVIADKTVAFDVGLAFVALQIGAEGGVVSEHGAQFLLDGGRLRFEGRGPVEFCAIVELDLREFGEVVFCRLLQEDAGLAEQDANRLVESRRAAFWRNLRGDEGFVLARIFAEARGRALETRLEDVRKGTGLHPGDLHGAAIGAAGILCFAGRVLDIAQQEEGAKVSWGFAQYGLERGFSVRELAVAGMVECGLFARVEGGSLSHEPTWPDAAGKVKMWDVNVRAGRLTMAARSCILQVAESHGRNAEGTSMSYQLIKSEVLFRQRLLKASGFDPHGLDGIWGPNTAAADQAFLAASAALRDELGAFDTRTEGNILGLHIRAQHLAREFMNRAAAFPFVARIISGTRTYAEQDELYRRGRWGRAGPKVTNAKGGQSNHNFGIAWDVALFEGGRYMNGDATHDAQAYRDLAGHALVDGLEWGGAWRNFPDTPHYQVASPYNKVSEIRDRFEAGESYV